MVSFQAVQTSNAAIPTALPPGLVAVFVGATSGIGEYTLKAFAKHAIQPRVYFIGRSQASADRITKECKALNPEGEFVFLKVDVSLMKNVDDVCRVIKTKEDVINLLVLSQGALTPTEVTSENLRNAIALAYYSRTRFIVNLLPLLQRASALRRVVSILAGGREGWPDLNDWPLWKTNNPLAVRRHITSMVTLSLEHLSKQAPDVSFVHDFPGAVRSNLAKGNTALHIVLRTVLAIVGPFVYMPNDESGERHLFLATSVRYPPAKQAQDAVNAVPLEKGPVTIAQGTDGSDGSGVYTPDAQCESPGPKVVALVAKMRDEGVTEKLWEHTEAEFMRICGTVAT
ncbi:hypothetical protein LTR36_006705 [Oleoguttula mirabilis]|uniref:Uncharacterized protein n=1 Tax=Oleoguttula mirabilis TaxID=1507867 RepID=A0AAV9JBQ5_9PEZI|nr:hypothetical protein LTR36_006705 [Oleoguttula mirabilis]